MNKVKGATRHLGPAVVTVMGIVVLVFSLYVSTPTAPLTAASDLESGSGAAASLTPVATRVPTVQSMFRSGLDLAFEGRSDEAVELFEQAAVVDPTCAACLWGAAWTLSIEIGSPASGHSGRCSVRPGLGRDRGILGGC